MTSDRPYRAARPFEAAADEMIRCSGTHFDPQVVKAFTSVSIDVWQEIRTLASEPGFGILDHSIGREARHPAQSMAGNQLTLESTAGEVEVR
jgi:hypothetical protein